MYGAVTGAAVEVAGRDAAPSKATTLAGTTKRERRRERGFMGRSILKPACSNNEIDLYTLRK